MIDTFDGLPAHIRDDADTQEIRNMLGVYYEGVVDTFLAGNKLVEQLEETISHKLHMHVELHNFGGEGVDSAELCAYSY